VAGCGPSTQSERIWPERQRKLARLAKRGEIDATMIPTPEEEDFFSQLRVPYWPPEERMEQRLREYLRKK
jgi:DNA polymerase/3'-5' exonuclease PolX